MRTPRNDTAPVDSKAQPDAARQAIDGPVRKCILSREHDARAHLVRLALAPDGQVLPDVRAKAPGRGAWIGVTRAELEAAYAKNRLRGALARAFKTGEFTLSPDLPTQIAAALKRNALDRLGLEARGGMLLTGTDRIETAARSGQLHALYHAADAGEDGMRRLAQAWRVGTDREGSDLRGLALPVPRPILSLALGRENVVHIALTDRLAAKRVGDALDRWLHFIGPDTPSGIAPGSSLPGPTTAPCETASQGASAHRPVSDGREASPAATTHEEFE
jgi:predicted RNA-binding protein YlxR (DUF448 family)